MNNKTNRWQVNNNPINYSYVTNNIRANISNESWCNYQSRYTWDVHITQII